MKQIKIKLVTMLFQVNENEIKKISFFSVESDIEKEVQKMSQVLENLGCTHIFTLGL